MEIGGSPQQTSKPSDLIPQLYVPPANTDINSSDGGDDWPNSFVPQQTTEPVNASPQLWSKLADIDVNSPDGGDD